MGLKVIGFCLGDPGGIGPEVVFGALAHYGTSLPFVPVVFGSRAVLDHGYIKGLLAGFSVRFGYDRGSVETGVVYFVDVFPLTSFEIGRPDMINGRASEAYIRAAADAALSGDVDAVVTAPICKEAFQLADIPYSGHTTLLKDITGSESVSMGFYTTRLKTVLVTVHEPFQNVAGMLTDERLGVAARNSFLFAKMLGISDPKIVLAGLNPHASENGLFGDEERLILTPFVEKMAAKGVSILGPYSADTLYRRAFDGEFDIVISLYHDQGLIPIKLIGFEEAVNVTLGLPIIRTSPDHGTAFDIAYKGGASAKSMVAAMDLACRLIR